MIIVKVGGGAAIDWDYICQDIASLVKEKDVILVHGANAKRDEVARKLGTPTKYLTAPSGNQGVYTDKNALEILTMVYAGLKNKEVVSRLQRVGINALGLSGADGRIWEGKRKKNLLAVVNEKTRLVKGTFTGKVEKINSKLLKKLIKMGYLPVITQPAISYQGELINTDNDRNIAVMAKALKIKELVILFQAPGLLRDPSNEKTLVGEINKNELSQFKKYARGRMKKKFLAAEEAFQAGVEKIYWGDGRINKPISLVLSGKGTIIS